MTITTHLGFKIGSSFLCVDIITPKPYSSDYHELETNIHYLFYLMPKMLFLEGFFSAKPCCHSTHNPIGNTNFGIDIGWANIWVGGPGVALRIFFDEPETFF